MNAPTSFPRPLRPPARCRLCGQALAPLRAMRHNVCERPACLERADREVMQQGRRAVNDVLRARLPAGAGPAIPVVWIRPNTVDWVQLPDAMRAEQQQYLAALAADASAAQVAPAPPAEAAAPPAWGEVSVCTWCQGRCCRYGGENHAYLDASHLRRWQLANPGSTLAEAAQAYAERLPAVHAEGSCHYHGPQGCTLTREMRSSVCNRFACDGLREIQTAPAATMLFVMGRRAEVDAAVRADTDGRHPLPGYDTAPAPRAAAEPPDEPDDAACGA